MQLKIKTFDESQQEPVMKEVPNIAGLSIETQNIVQSDQNNAGGLVHDFVAQRRKLSAQISVIDNDTKLKFDQIFNQINEFDIDIVFNIGNGDEEMNCYLEDKGMSIAFERNGKIYWSGLVLSFVENRNAKDQ